MSVLLFAVFFAVAWTAWFFLLTGTVGRFYFNNSIEVGGTGILSEGLLIGAFALGTALVGISALYLLIWLDWP